VFVHLVAAVNTVDIPKLRTLKQKGRVQDDFLKSLRDYAKEKKR
jgi:hypothetical protein